MWERDIQMSGGTNNPQFDYGQALLTQKGGWTLGEMGSYMYAHGAPASVWPAQDQESMDDRQTLLPLKR